MEFTQAIVRTPCPNLINGLSGEHTLGTPDYPKALEQHSAYIEALTQCGLEVSVLAPLEDFADSCFVEDPAVVTANVAICTRPGAPSRLGEVDLIEPILRQFYPKHLEHINAPGFLDGGDVLNIDKHFYIGLSERTNLDGADQLIKILTRHGYSGSIVEFDDVLHLKTGCAYLGDNTCLVSGEFINHPSLKKFKKIIIDNDEAYAANALRINNHILLPKGFPKTLKAVAQLNCTVITLDMSEFQKVDGGLSCLSLRF